MLSRVAFALPLLMATAAIADAPPSHVAWTRAAIGSLPTFHEDRDVAGKSEQLDELAEAVARASSMQTLRPPREWAALVLAIGFHESTFSLRIHRGECNLLKRECDAKRLKDGTLVARARSPWQLHANKLNGDAWPFLTGIENSDLQALEASAALQRGYWTCARSGVPWLQGTINGYAGRMCSATWPGLQARIATFNAVVRVAVPKVGS
jgi:hypothetical protein